MEQSFDQRVTRIPSVMSYGESRESETEMFVIGALRKIIRDIITSIFEECIDQLTIIKNLNQKEGDVFTDTVIEYLDVDKRYGKTAYSVDVHKSFSKLSVDINMFINVLKSTINEIQSKGTHTILIDSVEAIIQMEEDDVNLLQEQIANRQLIKSIRRMFIKEQIENVKTIKKTNDEIQTYKFQLEDFIIYNSEEIKYFTKWEHARVEQNKIINDGKENEYETIIRDADSKIDTEIRCHKEIVSFLEENIDDNLAEIQHWMKQYDEDLERRDNELLQLRHDLEQLTVNYEDLQKIYNEHALFIEERLERKRLIKEQEEREQLEEWAATKIQAWWRGVMVRRKLGKYRKKKRKGKGKGKDKKGKKRK